MFQINNQSNNFYYRLFFTQFASLAFSELYPTPLLTPYILLCVCMTVIYITKYIACMVILIELLSIF